MMRVPEAGSPKMLPFPISNPWKFACLTVTLLPEASRPSATMARAVVSASHAALVSQPPP
jgi:hypothetical protein